MFVRQQGDDVTPCAGVFADVEHRGEVGDIGVARRILFVPRDGLGAEEIAAMCLSAVLTGDVVTAPAIRQRRAVINEQSAEQLHFAIVLGEE